MDSVSSRAINPLIGGRLLIKAREKDHDCWRQPGGLATGKTEFSTRLSLFLSPFLYLLEILTNLFLIKRGLFIYFCSMQIFISLGMLTLCAPNLFLHGRTNNSTRFHPFGEFLG